MKHKGLASHIISEAFAYHDIEVRYDFFPLQRALKEAEQENVHGTHTWFYSPERAEHFLFSDPVMRSEYVFFHLKTRRFDWNQFADLASMRIGITTSYYYGEQFEQARANKHFTISEVSSDEQNLKMLFLRRVDLVPMDPLVGYYQIHKIFQPPQIPLFTNHTKAFYSNPAYLLLNKRHPDAQRLMQAFNSGLKALKAQGRWEQMQDDLIKGKYQIKLSLSHRRPHWRTSGKPIRQ